MSFILIFTCCLLPTAYCHLPTASAQVGRRFPGSEPVKKKQEPPAETKPAETPTPQTRESEEGQEVDDEDAVKIETNLVTVPVIASDRGGRYIPDLKAEEFTVSEDSAEQKVAFFATVTEPFNVVLMIDTSASTTVDKIRQVQEAAVAFTEQLREGDRVKVISFDDEIRDLTDFTSDRAALASAIRSTRPGKGTRLYDAFDMAYRALGRLKGRKAVIMLTDGVDYRSDRRTYDDNRRAVEESDVIVYPVRFDTRAETEQLARAQARGGTGPVDIGSVLGIPGLPGSVIINPRGGGRRPEDEDRRNPTGLPDATSRRPGNGPGTTGPPRNRDEASDQHISQMLDALYRIADDYLKEMARTTGGTLVPADNPLLLRRSFQQIADELRTQYSLGYYPTNAARDGKFRKLRVRTTRKGVALRTRPGYRARKSS
ncbi:MAG TPA: VWA domain-containing protein [Pyrinomonadaceae bacterium]|nr:VWA domain-containing protein [Pyrinomonadaceae bacterium]